MAAFTELLGTAIANADSHDQLIASRARLLTAGDDARRRVVRDLHDGAQQRLVAVANLLKLAERHLESGDDAVEALRLAGDELGSAQTELRDLARGLHPVALSERGLAGTLESLIVGCEIPVTLDVAADDLPDDVELAAYFIVCESLTNARKYADATVVRIRVARVADALVVEIVDDGAGGADPSSGTGLRGLADRVDALDGRLELDSRPGAGTPSARACRCATRPEPAQKRQRVAPCGSAPATPNTVRTVTRNRCHGGGPALGALYAAVNASPSTCTGQPPSR